MQMVEANLITVSGDILRLRKVLESYRENGGPSSQELTEQLELNGNFKGVTLKGSTNSKFRTQFVQAVIDNLDARFDVELLKDCTFLDKRRWPTSDDRIIYGDREVMKVAEFFKQNVMNAVSSFREAKSGLDSSDFKEFCNVIKIFPVCTAECERGFSAMNDVFTKDRNRLSVNVCNAVLFLNINGPPITHVNFAKYVVDWLKSHRSARGQNRVSCSTTKLRAKHSLFSLNK